MPNGVMEQIDHVIVLMMENRSFDNMAAWLYEPGAGDPVFVPDNGVPLQGLEPRIEHESLHPELQQLLAGLTTPGEVSAWVDSLEGGAP